MRDPPWMVAPALGEGLRSQPPRRHLGCPPSTEPGDDRHPLPSSSSCPCYRGLSRARQAVYGPRTGVEQGSGRVNTVELTQRRGRSVWAVRGCPTPPWAGCGAARWHLHALRPSHLIECQPWSARLSRQVPGVPVTLGGHPVRSHPMGCAWLGNMDGCHITLRALLRSLG